MTFSSDVVQGLGPVPQQMFICQAAHLQASIAACEVNAEQKTKPPHIPRALTQSETSKGKATAFSGKTIKLSSRRMSINLAA